jgi:hypothetical protein
MGGSRDWQVAQILLLLLVSGGCGGAAPNAAQPLPGDTSKHPADSASSDLPVAGEQEIDPLVDFLKSQYTTEIASGKLLVIQDKTDLRQLLEGISFQQFVDFLNKDVSNQVPPELIKDFCDKNTHPGPIWPELGSRVPMRLFGSKDGDAIFHGGPDAGWGRFYQKYPGSPGIITVSRVGFNGAKNVAMFYVGRISGSLNGEGRIHVMKRQGDKWVETKVQIGPRWVS